jgi:hypothetical protein
MTRFEQILTNNLWLIEIVNETNNAKKQPNSEKRTNNNGANNTEMEQTTPKWNKQRRKREQTQSLALFGYAASTWFFLLVFRFVVLAEFALLDLWPALPEFALLGITWVNYMWETIRSINKFQSMQRKRLQWNAAIKEKYNAFVRFSKLQ